MKESKMKIAIYDPAPLRNDYLTVKYFEPMLEYGKDAGRDIGKITSFDGVANACVLFCSDYYTPEIGEKLKNNNNKIILFDINDSSYINNLTKLQAIDLMFKFSGIQQTRGSDELRVSDNFEYTKQERYFVPDDVEWAAYVELRDSGRLLPMLYAPFYHCEVEHIPYEQKEKKAVIRGGNHYLRYHLFLNLLKHGLVNEDSAFTTRDYFQKTMDERFIYCDECRKAFNEFGKVSYEYYKTHQRWNCNNSLMDWQQNQFEPGFFQSNDSHKWNNRCVPSFYKLSEEFEKHHGQIDWAIVENALNGMFLPDADFYKIINKNLLYGDYKWLFSVDIPPRFWQAASAKTINLLPAWTKNQSQAPVLVEGDHYLTFEETFSDIDKLATVTKDQHDHITNNCFELYTLWIKHKKYRAATHLMDHIFNNIESI